MKRFTFFSMSLLIMLAFSTSCETTSSDSGTAESGTTTETSGEDQKSRGLEMAAEDEPCSDNSILTEAQAAARIAAFNAQSSTDIFARGFQLSCGDIQILKDYIDPNNESPIFLMYGYDEDNEEYDLIFRTESNIDDLTTYTYFDFTKPCPSYCPSLDGCCETVPTIGQLNGVEGYWMGRVGLDSILTKAENGDTLYLMLEDNNWDQYLIFTECDSSNENCSTSWRLWHCGHNDSPKPCPTID